VKLRAGRWTRNAERPKMVHMRTFVLIGLLSQVAVVTPRTANQAIPKDWKTYRDVANGLSFRYPPDFRLSEPSIADSGIDGLLREVSLYAEGEYFSVLKVLVTDCKNRMAVCWDEASLRKTCDRLAPFPVGNRTAFQCVDYGRAACHWGAYVLLKGTMVRMISMATDRAASANTRSECANRLVPAMRAYPIEAMFSSFRFESPAA